MRDETLHRRLKEVGDHIGTSVSLYLDTAVDKELASKEIEISWKGLRREASSHGVPDKALLLLDDTVDGAHRRGRGLVAITTGEELVLNLSLEDVVRDRVRVAPIAHLIPLLEWSQHHPPYAVVVIDRTGAEIHVVDRWNGDRTIEVEGDHDEIRKVKPGGFGSQRRFQNRAEDSWERNAEEVAEELSRIMQRDALPLAIVMGDVRAVAFLQENAPKKIQDHLLNLNTSPSPRDAIEQVRPEIEAAVTEWTARRVAEKVDRFQEERGQADLATEGIDATLGALRMAQVETLFVSESDASETAWFAISDPTQVAPRREDLTGTGMTEVAEGPAQDVAVRAAIATDAQVVVIPREVDPLWSPAQGVGSILRFRIEGG